MINKVTMAIDREYLTGDLFWPDQRRGLIIFAHGSGSSRASSRNRWVAEYLADHWWAALLFDLLSEEEDRNPQARFNIALLARRMEQVTLAMRGRADTGQLALGYFGASTGAAAALIAAANQPKLVQAVVSRGGRPDLAAADLDRVVAPTLLIVGGNDLVVLELNKRAMEKIQAKKKLMVVPGATHLFEEPGALEIVSQEAEKWFRLHLK